MPVDTSSYPTQIQPPNALNTLSAAAGLQNTLNQNRLFQQQYNTNLAVSNIYKQAIKPDGTIDQDKLTQLLKTDPNASYGLPQAYQGSQEAQQRNININTSQLENARAHLQAVSGYLAPLIENSAAPTSADVARQLAHAVTVGMASPQEAAGVLATLPKMPNGAVDESKIKEWALQQQLNVMSAQERINTLSPPPTAVQTGQGTSLVRTPAVGAPSQAGFIPNQPSPTTTYYNPQTQRTEYVGNLPQGAGLPTGTAATAPFGTAETTGAAAQQGIALNRLADSAPDRKALLGNLEGDLQQFTSGPGADWTKVAAAAVNRPIQAFGGTGFNPKAIASQEEFTKQATQLAQAQFKALGGTGANEQLESAIHTSPNETLSKMGNEGIIQMLKGNEDAIVAKRGEWQQWLQSHGPGTYNEFSTQFNKEYDPRAFQLQYMSKDDAQKMLKGMSKAEQQKFNNAMNSAISKGWIQLPPWLQANAGR